MTKIRKKFENNVKKILENTVQNKTKSEIQQMNLESLEKIFPLFN